MKKLINDIRENLLFTILFLVLSIVFYAPIANKGPLNTHVWRQADCLSLTENYKDGAPFLEPQMNILLGNNYTTGKSAGEFPILYYTVGQLWKVFGTSYFIYRLVGYLILAAGIIAFYRSCRIIFENKFWSTIVSLLLFMSPTLAVYGVSFLPDVPAFSFVLIAVYYIVRYGKDNRQKFLFWALFFFALAGLTKISSLVIFVFLGMIFLLERTNIKTLGDRKLFPKWQTIFGFLSVLIAIIGWYTYAYYYNQASGFKYTFNDIDPLWKHPIHEIPEHINHLKVYSSHVFHTRWMIMTLFFLFVLNLFLWKKLPLFAYLANIFVTLGVGVYLLLWSQLIDVHDYYFVAVLAAYVGIILPFVYYLKTNQNAIYIGKITSKAVWIFFIVNLYICFVTIRLKTTIRHGIHPILDKEFVWISESANNDEAAKWQQYVDIQKELPRLGIHQSDKVICMSDASFNISLWFLHLKGWTNFQQYTDEAQIENLIGHGAKYLFVEEADLTQKPFLQPFATKEIGKVGSLFVYQLR